MGAGPIAAYLALCLIWGSTYLAIKLVVVEVPPWLMIGARCLIAGSLLGSFSLARGVRLPPRRGILSAAASGTLMFTLGQASLAFGETRVPSGQAAVLGTMLSLFMPMAAWALGTAARPGLMAALGLILGCVGVGVLANPEAGALDMVGSMAILFSGLSFAFGAAVSRRWPASRTSNMTSSLQMLFGGAFCLLASLGLGEWGRFDSHAIGRPAVLAFLYLITMGSLVAYAAFGWLVHIWRPARLATYTYVNPVVALVLGALMAGEKIGVREVVATMIILGAVALVMFGNRARQGG